MARGRRVVGTPAEIAPRLHAAGCVHAADEARLLTGAARTRADLEDMVTQRVSGVPLEQVVGFAEFCGNRIVVEPGVFVPRRRTEFLVREAARLIAPGAVVVDVCCGTGAIGVALAALVDSLELYACDIDSVAVRCARRNLAAVNGQVFEGDLYDALPAHLRGHVDLIVASPPYVPSDAVELLPAEARLHEPLHALDGGSDGMALHRRVIGEAMPWLAPKGQLMVECSDRQASPLAQDFLTHGLVPTTSASNELGATAVVGRRG